MTDVAVDEVKMLWYFIRWLRLARAIGVERTAELLASIGVEKHAARYLLETARVKKKLEQEIKRRQRMWKHLGIYLHCNPETFIALVEKSPEEAIRKCIYTPGTSTESLAHLWKTDRKSFWVFLCARIIPLANRRYRRRRSFFAKWAAYCQTISQ